jgi:hypothetical protein
MFAIFFLAHAECALKNHKRMLNVLKKVFTHAKHAKKMLTHAECALKTFLRMLSVRKKCTVL